MFTFLFDDVLKEKKTACIFYIRSFVFVKSYSDWTKQRWNNFIGAWPIHTIQFLLPGILIKG